MESLLCYKLVQPDDSFAERTVELNNPCWNRQAILDEKSFAKEIVSQNDSLANLRKIPCNEYSVFQPVHPDEVDLLQHIVVLDSSRSFWLLGNPLKTVQLIRVTHIIVVPCHTLWKRQAHQDVEDHKLK